MQRIELPAECKLCGTTHAGGRPNEHACSRMANYRLEYANYCDRRITEDRRWRLEEALVRVVPSTGIMLRDLCSRLLWELRDPASDYPPRWLTMRLVVRVGIGDVFGFAGSTPMLPARASGRRSKHQFVTPAPLVSVVRMTRDSKTYPARGRYKHTQVTADVTGPWLKDHVGELAVFRLPEASVR